jgi:hypothetical protein
MVVPQQAVVHHQQQLPLLQQQQLHLHQLHGRHPSLEQLSPQRRSFTAAALRKGTIKISEPVPIENSGPSPVWPPYPASAGPFGSATTGPLVHPEVLGSTASPSESEDEHDGDDQDAESVAELLDTTKLLLLANNVKKPQGNNHAFGRQDSFASPEEEQWKDIAVYGVDINQEKMTSAHDEFDYTIPHLPHGHSPPLRQHRSSTFLREDRDDPTPDQVPSLDPRSSTTDSRGMPQRNSAGSSTGSKRKRRSGSIRLAFRKMFSKREKGQEEQSSMTRSGPRHQYHKSVRYH